MAFLMRTKSPHTTSRSAGSTVASLGGALLPAVNRRREARCRADQRQAVSAQLIGGVDVTLRNVSRRGVMFESSMRMLVGARVTLRLRTAHGVLTLPGDVVRCRVSQTRHGRLRYETALALLADCPIDNDELTLTPAGSESVVVIEDEVIDAEAVESVTIDNRWC
jgi:hypothetical protein